jgi:c-di-GMP-binding flagellar brake protein YcgR
VSVAEHPRRLVPQVEGPGLEKYRLRTSAGLRAVLVSLAEHQALAGLFDGDRLLATVRVTQAEGGLLELRLARDAAAPKPGDPRRLMVVAFLDDVKVQFPLAWSGGFSVKDKVWTLPFPEQMWRVQRRRGYRVRPPRDRAVWVRIRLPDGPQNLRAEDLSVVGLGLRMSIDGVPPTAGTTWDDVHLHLVQDGIPHLVPCALVVRRVEGGVFGKPWRIGCALEGVPLPSAQVLHQFVVDLELADRARRMAGAVGRIAEP